MSSRPAVRAGAKPVHRFGRRSVAPFAPTRTLLVDKKAIRQRSRKTTGGQRKVDPDPPPKSVAPLPRRQTRSHRTSHEADGSRRSLIGSHGTKPTRHHLRQLPGAAIRGTPRLGGGGVRSSSSCAALRHLFMWGCATCRHYLIAVDLVNDQKLSRRSTISPRFHSTCGRPGKAILKLSRICSDSNPLCAFSPRS